MSYFEKLLSRLPADKRWIQDRIRTIKTAPDGAKMWLRDLSKNDFEHAEAVEEYVGKILHESRLKLKPEEIYLLIYAIYTHDVGYRINHKNHATHSHDLIIESPSNFFINDSNLATAIALICLAHGREDIRDLPTDFPVDFLSKTDHFDIRFLGALLLIADELDQGYLRVFNRKNQEKSTRHTVYHVEIGSQLIKIKAKPRSAEEWQELKDNVDKIQERLNIIHPILSDREVRIEEVLLYPKIWSQPVIHRGTPLSKSSAISSGTSPKVLFLWDSTALGTDILQYTQTFCHSVFMYPMSSMTPQQPHGSSQKALKCTLPLNNPEDRYDLLIWMLGEDFERPVHAAVLEMIKQNTLYGGGLIAFPFAAWSVSAGINEKVDEVLPVSLVGDWEEGLLQTIPYFEDHAITAGMTSFRIENTYERLIAKRGAECLIRDRERNPMLVIGSFGLGKVAYVNFCSHMCNEDRILLSPWQQSALVKEIITKTMHWACSREVP